MSRLGFSAPNLAVVAYAEVDGSFGSSTTCNSGVRTTRVGDGKYVVVLPTNVLQPQARDIILVQPKGPNGALVAKFAVVDDVLDATKTIQIFDGHPDASPMELDSNFSILILRTTITPPTNSPA